MTPPENGKPLWTEAQVESLLEDFFQKEMPAALREEHPALPTGERPTRTSANISAPVEAPRVTATPDRANSWKGGVVVVLSSLMILLAARMLWDPSPPSDSHGKTLVHPETKADSELSDRDSPAEPDPLNALRHDGQGPVESRPRLPHVGTGDPDQPDFPELDIEVFPLDPRSEPDRPPRKRDLPESGPSAAEESPMPEENRSLPESRSPDSNEMDEDDLEPLLPELRSQPPEPLGI